MNAAAEARLALEGDLHQALDSGQLRVAYQPQIDLLTGRPDRRGGSGPLGSPDAGQIAPDTFIPLAEESGLIVALDDWVMRTACAQVRAWGDAGLPAVRMAVNLSGRAFWRSRIVERVTEALARDRGQPGAARTRGDGEHGRRRRDRHPAPVPGARGARRSHRHRRLRHGGSALAT